MIRKKISLISLIVTLIWLTVPGFGQSTEDCTGSVGCPNGNAGIVILGCTGTIDCKSVSTPAGSYVECDGTRWDCPIVPN